jgi:hypothetical protein
MNLPNKIQFLEPNIIAISQDIDPLIPAMNGSKNRIAGLIKDKHYTNNWGLEAASFF